MMKFNLKLFAKILFLFGLTQLLGIFLAAKFLPEMGPQSSVADIASFRITDYLYLAVIIFIFFFFSIKYPRIGAVIYRIFLSLIIFASFETFIGIWADPVISASVSILAVVIFWVIQSVIIQDIVMVVALATIGSVFGLTLTPMTVVYILIIFSVYDIVAVYITGHMVKMADNMIKARAIFGFIIPSSIKDFGIHVRGVQPGEQFIILGSGDVLFPIILASSLIRTSIWHGLTIFVFSLLGLMVMHLIFINQKIRRPMAALPPIAALTILGYFITRIF